MLPNITTEANAPVTLSFRSKVTYQNPFKEVVLDAVFTTPAGLSLTIPAYWAGGDVWCVRYAASALGHHTFVSQCNDQQNTGLHLQTGSVNITPYWGESLLKRHGALRVADDRRHLAYADGTPFFWLGDTWWMGLTKRLTWPENFKQLVADRKAKGFTVVQIVAGLLPDMPAFDVRGENEAGFPWEDDFSSIRPAFFDAADQRIFYLAEQDLVPCIVGAWGYYLMWLGTENMQLHWRYLIARWGVLPVVWVAAGEQTMPWYLSNNKQTDREYLKEAWTKVIQGIRKTDGFKRLLTTHPVQSARASVRADCTHLLDIEMQQTGHGNPTPYHAQKAAEGWHATPFMPVINGESHYEGLEIYPPVSARDARQAFWVHMLNSGCAGHTYGANGIWQVNLSEQVFGNSPTGLNWGTTPWQKAMQYQGAQQIAAAKRFLQTLPWNTLQAHCQPTTQWQTLWRRIVAKCSSQPIHEKISAAAISADKTLALFYVSTAQPLVLNMRQFPTAMQVNWFNPAAGTLLEDAQVRVENAGTHTFKPPRLNADNDDDWILILQK